MCYTQRASLRHGPPDVGGGGGGAGVDPSEPVIINPLRGPAPPVGAEASPRGVVSG